MTRKEPFLGAVGIKTSQSGQRRDSEMRQWEEVSPWNFAGRRDKGRQGNRYAQAEPNTPSLTGNRIKQAFSHTRCQTCTGPDQVPFTY